jgi:transposase
MDIHKCFAMIAAVNDQQQVEEQPLRVEMAELSQWAASHLTRADRGVIEATTNAWRVDDELVQYAGQVLVANPYQTKLIAQARIKSDKVDALALARLLASNFIAQGWVPDAAVRHQRAWASHRATLQRQCTRIKNRIHNLLRRHNLACPHKSLFSAKGRAWLSSLDLPLTDDLQRGHLLRQLELLQEQLDQADRLVARLSVQDERVPRLMPLTGIGDGTAFSILASIGDVHRFSSPNSLTAYAGLTPSLHQSGNRSFHGHITQTGSPILRWLMVEAARCTIRFDPHWRHIFNTIARRRGNHIATVAVARTRLVVIWHLLYHRTAYRYLQPQTFVRKLQEWAFRISSAFLPSPTSPQFVQACLASLDFDRLANSLTTDPGKGCLLVPAA